MSGGSIDRFLDTSERGPDHAPVRRSSKAMRRKGLNPQCNTLAPPVLAVLLLCILGVASCSNRISGPAKMVLLTLKTHVSGAGPGRALSAATAASADSDSSHVVVTFTKALLVVRDVRFLTAREHDGDGNEAE